jgi:hypothetical protein
MLLLSPSPDWVVHICILLGLRGTDVGRHHINKITSFSILSMDFKSNFKFNIKILLWKVT